mgnify:CR=1 FL=1
MTEQSVKQEVLLTIVVALALGLATVFVVLPAL